MVSTHYLDDAFICAKYYISPKNVSFKKTLKSKLRNYLIHKLRSIMVLQIISIITKQPKHGLAEEPYILQKLQF